MIRLGIAWGLLLTALVALAVVVTAAAFPAGPDGQHQTITFRYSKFIPEAVTVRAGTPVTFTLRNNDPIIHEWIVGTDDVHAGHRTGTEAYHDHLPTEVSVQPFATRKTTVTFDTPGVYRFICHLPGHEAYGMTGTLTVLPP